MKKTHTQKMIALMLAAVMLCALFTACASGGGESSGFSVPSSQSGETGTVITEEGEAQEIPGITLVSDSTNIYSEFLKDFLASVPGYGTEFNVEYQILGTSELSEPDHTNQLAQIRTEMMAGKGPDIFLSDCFAMNYLRDDDSEPYFKNPIFNYPEQAMANHIFLPLDGYIANAEYMEWDKMNQTIMAAGKHDGKQMILPTKYKFNVTCIDKERYTLPQDLPMTRQEMLDSGDLILEYAAKQDLSMDLGTVGTVTARQMDIDTLSYFGQLADYEKEELNFTEEELLALAMEGKDMAEKQGGSYFDALTSVQEEAGFFSYPVDLRGFTGQSVSYMALPDYIMVPSYNRDGGVTAGITCFAAINANTENPDLAFRVLDKLMSENVHQGESLVSLVCGVSVYDELGSMNQSYRAAGASWYLSDWNYAQFAAIRDQINAVKFYGLLDKEAQFTVAKAHSQKNATEEDVQKAVHSAYTTMKMMLAES